MTETYSRSVPIFGIEYKIAYKGDSKFARFKPGDEWKSSTMPIYEIEKALRDQEINDAREKRIKEETNKYLNKNNCAYKVKVLIEDFGPLTVNQIIDKLADREGFVYSNKTISNALINLRGLVEMVGTTFCSERKRNVRLWGEVLEVTA